MCRSMKLRQERRQSATVALWEVESIAIFQTWIRGGFHLLPTRKGTMPSEREKRQSRFDCSLILLGTSKLHSTVCSLSCWYSRHVSMSIFFSSSGTRILFSHSINGIHSWVKNPFFFQTIFSKIFTHTKLSRLFSLQNHASFLLTHLSTLLPLHTFCGMILLCLL